MTTTRDMVGDSVGLNIRVRIIVKASVNGQKGVMAKVKVRVRVRVKARNMGGDGVNLSSNRRSPMLCSQSRQRLKNKIILPNTQLQGVR